MIQRPYVLEWRKYAPWQLESQIEQDFVLSRALVQLFSNKVIQQDVALRGGTALNKLFFKKHLRYSEDIDLVRVKSGPGKPLISAIQEELSPWLGKPRVNLKQASITLIFRFLSDATPPIQLRLKVETNTREHKAVLKYIEKPFEMTSRWFSGSANIRTFDIEEILATKLRALYQRRKGRDLLDLYYALDEFPDLNISNLISIFQHYMKNEGKSISRAEFENNLFNKMSDKPFLDDTETLLVSDASYNAPGAYKKVLENFINKLPGEPWAGPPDQSTGGE